MFSNYIRIAAILVVAFSSSLDKPAQGQASASGNQSKTPIINNDTSKQETRMQAKLQSMYETGKMDADAVASYQQRLDEMRANEEVLRAQGGMTSKSTNDLLNKLEEMDHQMDKEVQDRAKTPSKSASYTSSDNPADSSSYTKSGADPSESSSYTKSGADPSESSSYTKSTSN